MKDYLWATALIGSLIVAGITIALVNIGLHHLWRHL